ncbi:dicarboxylate/amino acid:cation symporter [Corallincola luteus]|uniref:Dicarboxylate/amino acid:cation symporter n=2 Tax=Corallincola TaxID=1775176 RepID=A0A368NNA0_9GAMM|nr:MULTISPECIES: dicarboxylate/amino acid:cation symporter [Corallincola]RCU51888.1 dicarboxylate/amino acid:cation symporter [Corallincola holothuriorum]TCI05051.1 dicarboxylate/amino acid:cation symporter [Corallincola luteus]
MSSPALAVYRSIPFWQKVLAGFVLGATVGLLLPEFAVQLKPLGDLFINAIRMLVVPLVFCSLVMAVTSLGDDNRLGRIGIKTVGLFLLTAVIASALGLLIGSMMNFSAELSLTASSVRERDIPPFAQVLVDVVPRNPIAAMAEGNILQVLLFAVLVGVAINQVGDKAEPVKRFLHSGAEVMYQITRMVLALTPYGVFGLIAWMLGSFGLDSLLPLAKFVVAIYIACLIHIVLVYGTAVQLFGGISIRQFFKAVFPAQLVAYASASSYGTLPVSTRCVTEGLGVSRQYASFVLPMGATINMDGCGGIYPAIAAIFIAQIYGIPLGWIDYGIIMATATLASIGTAGVPGTAMVMLTVTLNAVGLPLEGIAFVAAIDRIIDMMRTATNVTGDMMVARVIGYREGLLVTNEPTTTINEQSATNEAN